jgi:hypothetical protein
MNILIFQKRDLPFAISYPGDDIKDFLDSIKQAATLRPDLVVVYENNRTMQLLQTCVKRLTDKYGLTVNQGNVLEQSIHFSSNVNNVNDIIVDIITSLIQCHSDWVELDNGVDFDGDTIKIRQAGTRHTMKNTSSKLKELITYILAHGGETVEDRIVRNNDIMLTFSKEYSVAKFMLGLEPNPNVCVTILDARSSRIQYLYSMGLLESSADTPPVTHSNLTVKEKIAKILIVTSTTDYKLRVLEQLGVLITAEHVRDLLIEEPFDITINTIDARVVAIIKLIGGLPIKAELTGHNQGKAYCNMPWKELVNHITCIHVGINDFTHCIRPDVDISLKKLDSAMLAGALEYHGNKLIAASDRVINLKHIFKAKLNGRLKNVELSGNISRAFDLLTMEVNTYQYNINEMSRLDKLAELDSEDMFKYRQFLLYDMSDEVKLNTLIEAYLNNWESSIKTVE